jgi:hypothetical protein
LHAVIALGEQLTFTKAALRLHLTESAQLGGYLLIGPSPFLSFLFRFGFSGIFSFQRIFEALDPLP